MTRFRAILSASAVGIAATAFYSVATHIKSEPDFQYSHIDVSGRKAIHTLWANDSDNAFNLGASFSYTRANGQKKMVGVYVCSAIIDRSQHARLTLSIMRGEKMPPHMKKKISAALQDARKACFAHMPGA